MKKVTTLIFATILMLSIAACGDRIDNTSNPTVTIRDIEQFEKEFDVSHHLMLYDEKDKFTATGTIYIVTEPKSTGLRVEKIVLNVYPGDLWKPIGNSNAVTLERVAEETEKYAGSLEIEYNNNLLPLFSSEKSGYFDRYNVNECIVVFTDSYTPSGTKSPDEENPVEPIILMPNS